MKIRIHKKHILDRHYSGENYFTVPIDYVLDLVRFFVSRQAVNSGKQWFRCSRVIGFKGTKPSSLLCVFIVMKKGSIVVKTAYPD